MKRKALIVYGGWDGHQPREVAGLLARVLGEEGFEVESRDTLEAFDDEAKLRELSLIVPHWTMGKISDRQCAAVCHAVMSGVGIAGFHGGMCDAFRESTDWQFMTGGQWVAHPGNDGVEYAVEISLLRHPVTAGIENFTVRTEQYYLHVDPGVQVLASTHFPVADGPHAGNPCEMPVIWTKSFGHGRVYYNALGHHVDVLEREPVLTLLRRGLLWAARG